MSDILCFPACCKELLCARLRILWLLNPIRIERYDAHKLAAQRDARVATRYEQQETSRQVREDVRAKGS